MSLSAAISPVYAYSKADLANAPEAQGKPFQNYIAGVRITWEESSASKARQIVEGVGRFVRDRIIIQRLYDYVSEKTTKNENFLRTNENQIIHTNFSLLQNRARAESLRSILKELPLPRTWRRARSYPPRTEATTISLPLPSWSVVGPKRQT
jgi:hypothetical protein